MKYLKRIILAALLIALLYSIVSLSLVKRYSSDFWVGVYFKLHGVHNVYVNVVVPGQDGRMNLYFPDGCDSSLLRGFRQIEHLSGGFRRFDLADIAECKNLQALHVPCALLSHEQNLLKYDGNVSIGALLENTEIDLWKHISEHRWPIVVIMNRRNMDSIINVEFSKYAHSLYISDGVLETLTFKQLERLKECHYECINDCRSDYFWSKVEKSYHPQE